MGDAAAAYEGEIYGGCSCTLAQADVEKNTNKFFMLRLVKHKKKYRVLSRSGRVGATGSQWKEEANFSSGKRAVARFSSIFNEKTGNDWYDPEKWVPKANKFTFLETVPEEGPFGLLLLNPDSIGGLNFDPREMPLGRLSKNQILLGLKALFAVEMAYQTKASDELKMKAMSLFYTRYPCNVGGNRKKLLLLGRPAVAELREALSLTLRMLWKAIINKSD
ncbi:protein mono-ADP-ribosyltransferase PARP3 isoform X2 [Hyalella azteca]|nr:protein mono-ADP-ribosyltransferase PARP3 isoform X2 [Hyalella azteca]